MVHKKHVNDKKWPQMQHRSEHTTREIRRVRQIKNRSVVIGFRSLFVYVKPSITIRRFDSDNGSRQRACVSVFVGVGGGE